jgi:hypothetical protein
MSAPVLQAAESEQAERAAASPGTPTAAVSGVRRDTTPNNEPVKS